MKAPVATLLFIFLVPPALAETLKVLPSHLPTMMEQRGAPLVSTPRSTDENFQSSQLQQIETDVPTTQLLNIARQSFSEVGTTTRSAKDAEIYRAMSPSVVEIVTSDATGSGSLIGTSGEILTNYHVVQGYSDVGIIFKPPVEGKEPTHDDIKLGHVVKFDEVADLALLKAVEVPKGRNPIRLGDSSDLAIGTDVHAIGHPRDLTWTYTTGIISQYRIGFEWTIENIKHKADVIQTQTPISPGNSGGPLIGESSTLIGVNTLQRTDAENLNFAVSVDDVKRFLARQGNRLAQGDNTSPGKGDRLQNKNTSPKKVNCEPKEISRSRNKDNDAVVIEYDIDCSGRINANYVIPDKKTEAILLMRDRNGDGRPDVIYFDFDRRGKWDLSFWDNDFSGHWTLVGYHGDGSLNPTSYESYEVFQARRLAKR
jgi:S1-C subfamily serine protease